MWPFPWPHPGLKLLAKVYCLLLQEHSVATSQTMGNIAIVLIIINAVHYSVDIFSDQAYGSVRSLPIFDDRIVNQSDGSRDQIGSKSSMEQPTIA